MFWQKILQLQHNLRETLLFSYCSAGEYYNLFISISADWFAINDTNICLDPTNTLKGQGCIKISLVLRVHTYDKPQGIN